MALYKVTKKQSGGGKLWIFNPDIADEVSLLSGLKSFSDTSYVYKVKDNDSGSVLSLGGSYPFNGTTQPVIYRNGQNIAGVIFLSKIPHGVYQKLYVYCQVTVASATAWKRAFLTFSSALGFSSDAIPTNSIKTVTLVDDSKTPAQINSQTGVTINSTDSSLLSAQVVEVDVSGISQDFYFGFWNCDRTIAIRSIYFE